jgi:hypothetical protein
VTRHIESRSAVQYLLLRNLKTKKGTVDSCCWIYLQNERVPANWERVVVRKGACPVCKSPFQTTEALVETHLIRRNWYKLQDSLCRRDGRIGQAISYACRTVCKDGASVRGQGRTIFKSGLLLPPMSGSFCKMICTTNEKDLTLAGDGRWHCGMFPRI